MVLDRQQRDRQLVADGDERGADIEKLRNRSLIEAASLGSAEETAWPSSMNAYRMLLAQAPRRAVVRHCRPGQIERRAVLAAVKTCLAPPAPVAAQEAVPPPPPMP
jgi:hypothetical protein